VRDGKQTYDIESPARFSFNPVTVYIALVFEQAGVFELVEVLAEIRQNRDGELSITSKGSLSAISTIVILKRC
jgi:hypothetical protein